MDRESSKLRMVKFLKDNGEIITSEILKYLNKSLLR